MKRVLLFLATNLAVVLVLGIVANLLGVNRFLTSNGLNLSALLGFALIMGFGGAIISLLISKPMAKFSTGARVINQPQNADEAWIVQTVEHFANQANIGMPEVAIFDGEPNAFATGAFKNSALVAVSTGLLRNMTREEVEAVIGHEVAHIANGDMVTMTLLQGVLNAFVMFFARILAFFAAQALAGRAFGALIAARRGQQMAEVTTAHALTDTQRAQIAARLTEAGYSNVRLSETIDKSILGGLIVRIGSRLYDNSIKSKFQRLQYAMKGAA